MSKLKQLETFVAVVARGGLTAAAKVEGVAPAIIGRRLDALEERLGVKLLVRTTRRVSLTHEGSAFLEDCQRLLSDLANAEASVSAGGVKASGHLSLTAPAGFGRRHVAPLVPRFRELHPDVTISLNLSDRVVDLAAEGYDCAVRVGEMPDSSLARLVGACRRLTKSAVDATLLGDEIGRAWVMCESPPASLLLRAQEPDSPIEAFTQQSPGVWVRQGWAHPAAEHLAVPPDCALFLRPPRSVQVAPAPISTPVVKEYVLPTTPLGSRVTSGSSPSFPTRARRR